MKKIALLLAMAIAFTSIATAADVTVGGWIDSRGGVVTKSGSDYTSDQKDAKLYVGSQEFEVAAAVTGERFGGRIGLIHWSGENGAWSGYSVYDAETPNDTSDDVVLDNGYGVAMAPFLHNSYIYSEFVPGKVKLYAGVQMFAFGNYTSYAVVDGANFGDDAFGLGLGAYNYASYVPMTKKPTGLALELKPVDGLSLLAILDVESQTANANAGNQLLKLEDAMKDNLHFNAKYAHEMVTVYTGLTLSDKDNADKLGNAFYVEASIKAMEGLTSDLKFEYVDNKVSDNAESVISANLGYDLGAAKVASEINQHMRGGDSDLQWTNKTHIGLSVTPVVPVVNLVVKGSVDLNDKKDSETLFAVGAVVSKAFGQANNNLGIRYVKEDKNKAAFIADYKITLWF